jgi:hypothetical protein
MRTRLWRKRQRNGQMMVLVEIDGEIIDALVGLQWLAEVEIGDKAKIGPAINRLLHDVVRGVKK